MANTVSPNFTDEFLCQELRIQFPLEQMWDMDFKIVLSMIDDLGDCLTLRLRGQRFYINTETGEVSLNKGDVVT